VSIAKRPHSGAPERLDRLTKLFFGTTIDKDEGHPGLACLGYQLIAGLAGTLADAKCDGADHAVFLIHEFETVATEPQKHANNRHVLEDFLTRLYRGEPEREGSDAAWITTPALVRGDGDRMPESALVSIAKLVTDRRARGGEDPIT